MRRDLVRAFGAEIDGDPDNGAQSPLVTLGAVAAVVGIAYATDPFRPGLNLPWRRKKGGTNELLDRVSGSRDHEQDTEQWSSHADTVLVAMKAVYAEQYGWSVTADMAASVIPGRRDPQRWAPNADTVVLRETGWPPDSDGAFWNGVDERLARSGVPLYHQPINQAVIAFYPD